MLSRTGSLRRIPMSKQQALCNTVTLYLAWPSTSLSDKKKLSQHFLFFFSPQLILQKSNGQLQRNLSFFKVQEGVQHFPGRGGGSNFIQGGGGVHCLIPIETHITCYFPSAHEGTFYAYTKALLGKNCLSSHCCHFVKNYFF